MKVLCEWRAEGYVTGMMTPPLSCAYTWLDLITNSHIISCFSCVDLFISATCFSRVLWCAVCSLKKSCSGFALSVRNGAPQEADAGVCGETSEQ